MKARIASCSALAFFLSLMLPTSFGQTPTPKDGIPFGTRDIGTTSPPVSITLANPESVVVTFTVQPDLPDFSIDKNECTRSVPSKGACVVYVTFSPVAQGDRLGHLTATYQSGTDKKSSSISPILLTGYGKLPDLSISSTRISFLPVHVGKTSSPEMITLTNNLTEPSAAKSVATDKNAIPNNNASAASAAAPIPLKIIKVVISGPFSVEGFTGEITLDPGKTLVLVVRFTPSTEGASSGMLTILSNASTGPQDVYLSGATSNALGGLCTASHGSEIFLCFVLCLFYWIAMVVVRWNRVALPTREFLRAELNSLEAELETLDSEQTARVNAAAAQLLAAQQKPATPATVQPQASTQPAPVQEQTHPARVAQVKGLIQHAKGLIDGPQDPNTTVKKRRNWRRRFANFLFWSRGQELTGWGYVYEAQIQMVPLLTPETVVARLESNAQQLLLATDDAPSAALATAIHQQVPPAAPTDPLRQRALLVEALNANCDREEKLFSNLVSWQNKTAWLVLCGLLLIVTLTAAIPHHSILFLVGALGGLISRLSRELDRKDVKSDYGASWTTLFLSPVGGALGAWAGILVSGLAVSLGVLGSVFNVDWADAPCQSITLAIALLFGFSERLLDGVFDKLASKTGVLDANSSGSSSGKKQGQTPPPVPPVVPPAAQPVLAPVQPVVPPAAQPVVAPVVPPVVAPVEPPVVAPAPLTIPAAPEGEEEGQDPTAGRD